LAADNTVSRSLHDLGLAAWFGGALMGAVGLNGAAAQVEEPKQRLRVATAGWNRWTPVNLAGGAVLLGANKTRLASQQGVARASVVKAALTGAALAATAWSRTLGARLEEAGEVPVQGGTDPTSADTPEEVATAQRRLKVLQWVVPALTGAVLVLDAGMGEQQRPAQVTGGLLGRLRPGRAT
jgi:hypothetical protein